MARIPYLQRRGYGLTFRIATPHDLRHIVGTRELTKALPTANTAEAIPLALEYAAFAKRLFGELRASMSSLDEEKLKLVGQLAKEKIRRSDAEEEKQRLEYAHLDELRQLRQDAARQVSLARLEAENAAMKRVLASGRPSSPTSSTPSAMPPLAGAPTPRLKVVVENFLAKYQKDKKSGMHKKHSLVLPMLLNIVGDKPINELKQADINNFFELLSRLPPRWSDECRKRSLTIQELSKLTFDKTLGPKSLEDTYIASVRPFLKAAKKDWQDQGFPLGLTTEGIEYLGEREENENKQRAFKPEELKRLFEGEEMKRFAMTPELAHYYWLPHIGLFTGARVNEICQLNPQTDILQDEDSGVWHFWITADTEADAGIKKSVKTSEARKVPIHNKLIELGFIDYVADLKAKHAKRLFPAWKPYKGRASGEAEKWFRQLLRDTNLRDETDKAKLLGMHAFRHTLLTYGARQTPPLSLFCITGHAQDEAPIHATGAGKGYLTLSLLSPITDRQALLDQLCYSLSFYSTK